MEAQVDGGSNSNIFILEIYVYIITYTTGQIMQVTGDPGEYTGIGIVLTKIGDIIIPLYPSYLMKKNPQIQYLQLQSKNTMNFEVSA